MTHVRNLRGAVRLQALPVFLVVTLAMIGCGKKGAPLPPLVRVPAAPAEFTAERRGDDVQLQLLAVVTVTVPGPPLAGRVWLVGEIVNEQAAAAWVTL